MTFHVPIEFLWWLFGFGCGVASIILLAMFQVRRSAHGGADGPHRRS